MPSTRPTPRLRGEEQIYFSEAAAGRLVYQRCADCGTAQFYPRSVCTTCLSERLDYVEASGRGTIYSFTTVHVAGNPSFVDRVPYTVALVTLEEGPRVITDLEGIEPTDVHVGAAVEVFFEALGDDLGVPRFRAVQVEALA